MPEETKLRRKTLEVSRSRLEFLFDGVFAVAMTTLVLELKAPEIQDRHSMRSLVPGLLQNGATLGSYILSFVMLGIMWYRHQDEYRFKRRFSTAVCRVHISQSNRCQPPMVARRPKRRFRSQSVSRSGKAHQEKKSEGDRRAWLSLSDLSCRKAGIVMWQHANTCQR